MTALRLCRSGPCLNGNDDTFLYSHEIGNVADQDGIEWMLEDGPSSSTQHLSTLVAQHDSADPSRAGDCRRRLTNFYGKDRRDLTRWLGRAVGAGREDGLYPCVEGDSRATMQFLQKRCHRVARYAEHI